jgi:hypothetical protein
VAACTGRARGVRELNAFYQFRNANPQRIRDQLERTQRHTLLSVFESVHMHAVQSGLIGEFVLRNSPLFAQLLNPQPDGLMDVLQSPQARERKAIQAPCLKAGIIRA